MGIRSWWFTRNLAGIEYVGVAGITKPCVEAIERLLQYDDHIKKAVILTHRSEHALLLTFNTIDRVAVKAGFASGYRGEGPRSFSYVLQLLHAHDVDVSEVLVDSNLMGRLNKAALTKRDIETIRSSNSRTANIYGDYIELFHSDQWIHGTLWEDFRPVIPFAIIDPRLMPLAIKFWQNPDSAIVDGYRMLEDRLRERTKTNQHGKRLFEHAFVTGAGKLSWSNDHASEKEGRAKLFSAAYAAHRNPRMHKSEKGTAVHLLREFLLLNHLFVLESEAMPIAEEATKPESSA